MSLWVDKYRPSTLAKLDYHKDQAAHLRKLVEGGDFPHLLVYGPSGAGKKTRIMCTLRELYGPGVEKLRIEQSQFTTPSNKKLEISTISSNYHIEVNPSDVGHNDRVVIQELIKNVAQVNQLDTSTQKNFKVVVLTEVDRLSKEAQHALRRTMEKYMATCRLILCCNSTSKVIPAIRSRCLGLRVSAPSIEEICQILTTVCKKEGLTLPKEMAEKVAEKSGRNLRRALLMCEACRVQQYPFNPERDVSEPDWEIYLRETATMIAQQQSPKSHLKSVGTITKAEVLSTNPTSFIDLIKNGNESSSGSNKGVGFAIVRALCKNFKGDVILTARNPDLGKTAIQELEKEGLHPKFHQLDITDHASVVALRDFLQNTYQGLDVLVNNAGIAYKVASTAPFAEQAEVTLKTNYFSTLDACEVLYPLLRPHARVSNISSMVSQYALGKCSDALKARFVGTDITMDELSGIMNKFIQSAQNGTFKEKGFAETAYGMSKLGVTVMSMIQQREMDKKGADDIVINACCPGYVDTDMSSHKGKLTIDQGAETPSFIALLPPGVKEPRGQFVREKQVADWKMYSGPRL